ncbi:MAG: prepilin-type N-terminal cleavage/methylation domain-containing protein [Gammaproteobacteria bacterium]
MTRIKHPAGKEAGFTLVELLIVAIILAILAAIVVPQFASSTDDAEASALRSNLAGIRSAIDLYYQQHGSTFPGAVAATGGTCTGGTAGAGLIDTGTAFEEQLKYYSNAAGQTCSIRDVPAGGVVEFPFGPYIKGDVPANPVTGIATIAIETTGNLAMTAPAATSQGWRYDTTSGKFIADDSVGVDSNGTVFDTY